MDHGVREIAISDFINRELILFSMADNLRSIPSSVDGMKPGHRKILYCCFKRNLKAEIKVTQLAGYVSEHSAYHHGEASLFSTIVGMAQNFVGSNNLNVLEPRGQFGTRLQVRALDLVKMSFDRFDDRAGKMQHRLVISSRL
jgi:DNA topoisomerase II